MSTRFRKSINLGGGVRLNVSKKGVGVSAGTKGFRVSYGADGKVRRSVSIPGTGIYDVKVVGGKSKGVDDMSSASSLGFGNLTFKPFKAEPSPKNKKVTLLLCIFGGYFGLHYFYAKRYCMGILYLLTLGLFFIGWWYDIYRICRNRFFDNEQRFIRNS